MNKHRTILTWSILFIFGYAMSFNIINVCMVPWSGLFPHRRPRLMSSMINRALCCPSWPPPGPRRQTMADHRQQLSRLL